MVLFLLERGSGARVAGSDASQSRDARLFQQNGCRGSAPADMGMASCSLDRLSSLSLSCRFSLSLPTTNWKPLRLSAGCSLHNSASLSCRVSFEDGDSAALERLSTRLFCRDVCPVRETPSRLLPEELLVLVLLPLFAVVLSLRSVSMML